jgi:serine O-acetyltransferase
VLGGNTIIGDDVTIGGNAFIVDSIQSGTKVNVKNPELQFSQAETPSEFVQEGFWDWVI